MVSDALGCDRQFQRARHQVLLGVSGPQGKLQQLTVEAAQGKRCEGRVACWA